MRILALDTSTMMQSVAVLDGLGGCEERSVHARRGHTASLLVSIEAALAAAKVDKWDLDLVAVGEGPGSFTGLRIGMAAAKALCFATNTPIVTVSSLQALATNGRDAPHPVVVTANDARKREVYGAVWRVEGEGEPRALVPPNAFRPAALVEAVAQLGGNLPRPFLGVGSGFALYRDIFENAWGTGLAVAESRFWHIRASEIARLGRRRYEREGGADLVAVEPRYMRPSEAELKWSGGTEGERESSDER